MSLKIIHDLSTLSASEIELYKKNVSEFVGISPELNAFDTIWMENENSVGKSLVLYCRRGTAEILRQQRGIEVSSLTSEIISGSVVFTATGRDKSGRQEIAKGSKYIDGLRGKQLDDHIMTASTRALRRLTMQHVGLGILDESEVKATVGDTSNPASGATLAGSPTVIPPTPTVVNNAPGKEIVKEAEKIVSEILKTDVNQFIKPMSEAERARQQANRAQTQSADFIIKPTMQEMRDEAARQLNEKVAKQADTSPAAPVSTPVETTPSSETEVDINPAKPKRARKPKNSVSLEGPEPEIVNNTPVETPKAVEAHTAQPAPVTAPVTAVLTPVDPVAVTAVPVDNFAGKPSVEQMADYRKRVSVYTSQLPSSENLGSVQKMRAFITKMSGTAPQHMTTEQWEEVLIWFSSFEERNTMKGLLKYINDALGVK